MKWLKELALKILFGTGLLLYIIFSSKNKGKREEQNKQLKKEVQGNAKVSEATRNADSVSTADKRSRLQKHSTEP